MCESEMLLFVFAVNSTLDAGYYYKTHEGSLHQNLDVALPVVQLQHPGGLCFTAGLGNDADKIRSCCSGGEHAKESCRWSVASERFGLGVCGFASVVCCFVLRTTNVASKNAAPSSKKLHDFTPLASTLSKIK